MTIPPLGIPGAAILINVALTNINRYVGISIVIPKRCEQNKPSRANDTAPPHICIVQPSGTTISVTLSEIPRSSLQTLIVYGSVAEDEQVVIVISHTLDIFLIYVNGFIFVIKHTGNIITNMRAITLHK